MKCDRNIKMKMYFFSVFFISESIFFLCRNQLLKSSALCFCFNQNKQARIACIRIRKMINKSFESVSLLKNNLNSLDTEAKPLTMITTSHLEMLFRFVWLMKVFKMTDCLYISYSAYTRAHLSSLMIASFFYIFFLYHGWHFEAGFGPFW